MPPGEDVIDLTGFDSESEPARKRQRAASPEDSDICMIVEGLELANQEGTPGGNSNEENIDLNDDEDLRIVNEQGAVWNADLPHNRNLCGVHVFSKRKSVDNVKHCHKCYCFVCDVKITECVNWGDGTLEQHHCNAHPGTHIYQIMRRTQKARKRAGERQATQAAAPALAPAPTNPRAPPAPRTNSDSLPSQPDRKSDPRSMNFGMFADQFHRALADEYGPSHVARMRTETTTTGAAGQVRSPPAAPTREEPRFITDPGPKGPKKLSAMPDPSLDSNAIELMRLSFRCKAGIKRTLAMVKKRLEPHGLYLDRKTTSLHSRYNETDDQLTLHNLFSQAYNVSTSSHERLWMQLESMPHAPSPPEPSPLRTRQVHIVHYDGQAKIKTYGVRVPSEATVQEIMDAAVPLAGLGDDEIFIAGLRVAGYYASGGVKFFAPSDKVTDDSKEAVAGGIYLWKVPKVPVVGDKPSYVAIGSKGIYIPGLSDSLLPREGIPLIVVPLDAGHVFGGPEASKAMLGAFETALKPYKVPNADEPGRRGFGRLGAPNFIRGSGHTHFGPERQFDTTVRTNLNRMDGGRIMLLTAEWRSADEYDVEALSKHEIDESASPEAMKETVDYLEASKKHALSTKIARDLPYSVAEELDRASIEYKPLAGNQAANPKMIHLEPFMRYKLELIPDSTDREETNGTLNIRVFTWRPEMTQRPSLFQSPTAWDTSQAAGRKRQRYHHGIDVTNKTLEMTMKAYLWEDVPYADFMQGVTAAKAKEAKLNSARNVTKLMEVMERGEMPAAPQPRGLTVNMHPYQLQSLNFMLDCEQGEGGFRRLFWIPLTTPHGRRYWYSPILKRASLEVPEMPWGGFCCEEMGLGKTIEVLGLVLANPPPPIMPGSKTPAGKLRSRATLVVCAVSLVGQWIAEAEAKLGGSLMIHQYHGTSRIRDAKRLATEFDLVVTTYATLSADYGGKTKGKNVSPLHGIEWWRLVLDESHTVKTHTVGHTKACIDLAADRRWCCTGTPISTDVADLFGQFCVLGVQPFNNKNFYDNHVRNAFGNNVWGNGSLELMCCLDNIMIRHTKTQVLGGQQVLQLPPLHEELVPVILTAEEQVVYKKAHTKSAGLFRRYQGLGNHEISKHLLQIMSLLLPMRRICSGGTLRPSELEAFDSFLHNHMANHMIGAPVSAPSGAPDMNLVAPADEECPICMDAYEAPAVTSCNHWFCKECLLGVLQSMNPRCPLCRSSQTSDQMRLGVTAAEAGEAAAAAAAAANAEEDDDQGTEEEAAAPAGPVNFTSESKVHALLQKLRAMRLADPSAKALIFSQYNATIEWLKVRLSEEGFGHRHISGSMPLNQRAKAIQAFQQDPPTTVFLLSMRAGAVGINLTAASHVFLLEPALNPALEEQAIGRAWRMGQRREVKVFRFYVQGSVEEHIMDLTKQRKLNTAGNTDGASGSRDVHAGSDDEEHLPTGRGRGGRNNNRVTAQDLAGSIRTDKQNLRAGELELLFRDPVFPPPRVPDPPVPRRTAGEYRSRFDSAAVANGGAAAAGAAAGGAEPKAAEDLPMNLIQLPPPNYTRKRRSKAGAAGLLPPPSLRKQQQQQRQSSGREDCEGNGEQQQQQQQEERTATDSGDSGSGDQGGHDGAVHVHLGVPPPVAVGRPSRRARLPREKRNFRWEPASSISDSVVDSDNEDSVYQS